MQHLQRLHHDKHHLRQRNRTQQLRLSLQGWPEFVHSAALRQSDDHAHANTIRLAVAVVFAVRRHNIFNITDSFNDFIGLVLSVVERERSIESERVAVGHFQRQHFVVTLDFQHPGEVRIVVGYILPIELRRFPIVVPQHFVVQVAHADIVAE